MFFSPATGATQMTQVKNNANGKMETPAAEMTNGEVLVWRKFPAHLTIAQMRSEIAWQQSAEFKRYEGR
jgi:hypothetical protein